MTDVLRRHGRIAPEEAAKHKAFERFEHAAPNDPWRMDFKGHFAMGNGRCHPLTVLDDHSRFAIGPRACGDETTETGRGALSEWFRRYGPPLRTLMDNGSPWGDDQSHPWTPLTVWLVRRGVRVAHSGPYHPQTQGKDERFHRTLKAELLRYETFDDLAHAQRRFDPWRETRNRERPHEALALATPASRYRVSPRAPLASRRRPIEYGPGGAARRVQHGGWFSYQGRPWRIGRAFQGQPVALRPSGADGELDVVFCSERVGRINLRPGGESVSGSEHETVPLGSQAAP